jgi:hypothetical protein
MLVKVANKPNKLQLRGLERLKVVKAAKLVKKELNRLQAVKLVKKKLNRLQAVKLVKKGLE